jgi:hypothetical protein
MKSYPLVSFAITAILLAEHDHSTRQHRGSLDFEAHGCLNIESLLEPCCAVSTNHGNPQHQPLRSDCKMALNELLRSKLSSYGQARPPGSSNCHPHDDLGTSYSKTCP